MSDTPSKPAPAPKPAVGSVWEIQTKGVAVVTRPDESQSRVQSTDGVARYVLDVPGTFTATTPEHDPVTVKAV